MSGKKREAALAATRAQEAAQVAARAQQAAADQQQQLIADLQKRLAAMEVKQQAPPPTRRIMRDLWDDAGDAAAERPLSFKLPAFYAKDPGMWFRTCQSVFRRRRVTASVDKFNAIVEMLPPTVTESCRSLLMSIDPEECVDPYEQLRDYLCRCFGRTKWQLAAALLDSPPLGDRKPTALLQDMRALIPEDEIERGEGTLFQLLYLRRLPEATRTAIVSASCKTTDEMAEMADEIHSMAQPTVAAVAPATIATDTVAAIKPRDRSPKRTSAARGRGGGGGGGRGAKRQQTPARSKGKTGWCKHHQRWGVDAFSCIPPCTYQEN
jgi:hypothetical protein